MKQFDCIFLNEHGDLNLSWDESDHEQMKQVILEKMNKGYIFFVIEKKFFGLYKKKRKLTKENFEKNIDRKNIVVHDKELEKFIKESNNAFLNNEKSSDNSYSVKDTLSAGKLGDYFKEDTSLVAVKPPVGG